MVFGKRFDLNRDGKLDMFERSLKRANQMALWDEIEAEHQSGSNEDWPLNEEQLQELKAHGLNYKKLSKKSEYERISALIDKGLFPGDFQL